MSPVQVGLTFVARVWFDFTTMSDFGAFVKETRERKGLSLREFCRLANLDPGNWSKVERGLFPPPKNRQSISDIAGVLLLEQGSNEWSRLFELAAVGHIPAGLLAEPSVVERFSVFFRLNRDPDRTDRGPVHASRIVMDGEHFHREISPPKQAPQPAAQQAFKRVVPKPGSVRSARGAREKKK